jgi:arylsulfatase A-like enzyme
MNQRPNVIVFFTDQQRWDSTGIHGNPLDLTPHFDQIAQRGTHLYHAFTCQPVCGPARAVLQTGKHATTVGCWRNGLALPATERTLAHHFHAAGYRTAYIGKWHLAKEQIVPPAARGGYEYWLGANAMEHCSDAYDTVMYDNDNRPVKLPGYRVDAQTDAAIRYIDAHRQEPFFLFLSFLEPHFQNHRDDYPAPDIYRDRYHGRWVPPDLAALGGSTHGHLGGYWGMVKRLDEALGRLQDALKSLGLEENTIILFTTDHGCHFKTRNSEYKRSCHESSIRIPTALIGGPFTGGGRVEKLVSLVDLPATLLDAAGIPVPKEMQGRSVLPLLGGRKAEWPDDVFVQISEAQVARAVRTQRWKYCVNAPDKDPSKDGSSDRYVEESLYDLLADPYELNNLIGLDSHRAVADRLRDRLLAHIQAIELQTPVIEPSPSRRGGQKRVKPDEINA